MFLKNFILKQLQQRAGADQKVFGSAILPCCHLMEDFLLDNILDPFSVEVYFFLYLCGNYPNKERQYVTNFIPVL